MLISELVSYVLWLYACGMDKKPATPRRHTSMLNIRMLPEHSDLIRQAAELAGVSLSDWIRERLIRAARKELSQAV